MSDVTTNALQNALATSGADAAVAAASNNAFEIPMAGYKAQDLRPNTLPAQGISTLDQFFRPRAVVFPRQPSSIGSRKANKAGTKDQAKLMQDITDATDEALVRLRSRIAQTTMHWL